jgi:hypothetical protein
MGTVGPGAIHLLNGLYDARKAHVPVLAICGQVPREEIGSDFFQEVDNDQLFADVACFNRTVTSVEQIPALLEEAVNAALAERGVAVLSIPGDVGGLHLPKDTETPRFVPAPPPAAAAADAIRDVAKVLTEAERVTLLVGQGARHARDEVLRLADTLGAPMVLTLKAKEGFEEDNPFEIGQSGLIGNPATAEAFAACDVLFLVGTDFPYREFYPKDTVVVQLDSRGQHIGRRTAVQKALVGDSRLTLAELVPQLSRKESRTHLEAARAAYQKWQGRQSHLTDPDYDHKPKGLLRRKADNPGRPDPPRAARRGRGAARRGGRRVHHGHRDVDGVAVAVRADDRGATAGRLLQPRLDGQRDADGARRAGAGPEASGRRVLRGRRPVHADGRPDHRPSATTCRSSWSCSTTAGSAWSSWRWSRSACRSSAPSCTTPTSRGSPRRSGCAGSA